MTSATPGPPSSPCVRLLNSHAPAGVPDEVRLRMSRAVPSSAATHSAARRGRGRFRLLDIVDVGCLHSGFARGCSTQRGPALRALT